MPPKLRALFKHTWPISLVAIVMAFAGVSPHAAHSNIAAWLSKLGISDLPSALLSKSADRWVLIVGTTFIICYALWAWLTQPKRGADIGILNLEQRMVNPAYPRGDQLIILRFRNNGTLTALGPAYSQTMIVSQCARSLGEVQYTLAGMRDKLLAAGDVSLVQIEPEEIRETDGSPMTATNWMHVGTGIAVWTVCLVIVYRDKTLPRGKHRIYEYAAFSTKQPNIMTEMVKRAYVCPE